MLELKPMLSALWRNKVAALLIALQLALTLAIVSNATVIVMERIDKMARPTGMDLENIFSVTFKPVDNNYDMAGAMQADLDLIRSLPGVIDASVTHQIPLSGSGSASGYYTEPNQVVGSFTANYYQTDPHFIEALGLNLVEGRNFLDNEMYTIGQNDRHNPAVVIVTKRFAERVFPDESAVGKFLYAGADDHPTQIIGVIERHLGAWPGWSLGGNAVFVPLFVTNKQAHYVVRTESGQRDALLKQVEAQLAERDPERVIKLATLSEQLAESYVGDNLMVKVLTVVIALLTLIVALGIVGLTFFWINQRTKQIGVRRALGATRANISRYFLVENSMIAGSGLLLGAAGATTINEILVRDLSQPVLPLSLLFLCALLLLSVSLVAALSPAMRAANISPAVATRSV